MAALIIGVDPGGTTGIAHVAFTDSGSPYDSLILEAPYGAQGEEHPVELIRGLIENWCCVEDPKKITVVAEQFVLEEGTHGVDTTALRVLGALEYLLSQPRYAEVKLVYQLRTAKRLVKDKHLKSLSLFSNSPHTRDAMRHIGAYALTEHPTSGMAKFFAQAYPSD